MASTQDHIRADLFRLTQAAVEAAERGQWELVDEYYRDRGTRLADVRLPVQEASDLLKLDQLVRERVYVAQASLTSLLRDAMAVRRRLKGFRQGMGALSQDSGRILVRA
jgi:hypothetical protein